MNDWYGEDDVMCDRCYVEKDKLYQVGDSETSDWIAKECMFCKRKSPDKQCCHIEDGKLYQNDEITNWCTECKRVTPTYNFVKDSGKREEFDTGSRRDTQENKGRYDLLSYLVLERLAIHFENGANKYGENNFRLGQPLGRYFSSAMRHMSKWMLGWKDEDHLTAAIWNLTALLETEIMIKRGKLPKELDDRWKPFLDDYEWSQK